MFKACPIACGLRPAECRCWNRFFEKTVAAQVVQDQKGDEAVGKIEFTVSGRENRIQPGKCPVVRRPEIGLTPRATAVVGQCCFKVQ
jgi:hypothetical protein